MIESRPDLTTNVGNLIFTPRRLPSNSTLLGGGKTHNIGRYLRDLLLPLEHLYQTSHQSAHTSDADFCHKKNDWRGLRQHVLC